MSDFSLTVSRHGANGFVSRYIKASDIAPSLGRRQIAGTAGRGRETYHLLYLCDCYIAQSRYIGPTTSEEFLKADAEFA